VEDSKNKGINNQFSLVKKKDGSIGGAQGGLRPSKKATLKLLCHYTIIDESTSKIKGNSEPTIIQPSNYNLYKFLTLPDPEQILNNSMDVSLINEHKQLEEMKTVEDYTKKNNVIVINNMNTFNVFKNTLIQPHENVELFDYSDYQKEVTVIASCFRAYKARKLYKIFRYCIRRIIHLQKFIRAWVIRNKFKRYLDVTKKVSKIQRVFLFLI
jgi:hypothetical protein